MHATGFVASELTLCEFRMCEVVFGGTLCMLNVPSTIKTVLDQTILEDIDSYIEFGLPNKSELPTYCKKHFNFNLLWKMAYWEDESARL